jgi:hypothetical protein
MNEAAPKPRTKPRLPALDSTRFVLIAYIALGHFMAAGGIKNAFALKFISQVNVVVGAFWVLSGYVAAYVSSELGKPGVIENRVSPLGPSFASRLMGYYPLYLLSQLLFLPVYLITDLKFGGPLTALKNAVMTTTLTQSWFPLQAEAWNAPTWFLSAMTFATPPMLLLMKPIAKMGQSALKNTFVALCLCSLLPKIWYSWTLDAWTIMEGMLNARTHPNIALFNVMRFNPVFALVELLLGIVGARMVMLKTEEETDASAKSGLPPALLVAAMVGGLLARTLGYLQVNDMIFRSVFFVPCFTWFLQRVHAVTAQTGGAVGLIKQMAGKLPTYLGSLAFPIFVLHGPIGQIFYKKVVATKLFGVVLSKYPMLFGVWCAVVLGSAALVQKYFVESAKVKEFAKSAGKKLGDMLS